MNPEIFTKIPLDDNHNIYLSPVIDQFNWNYERFAELWETHPENYHTLKIHGKEVLTPRWQQAYGKNYRYTGSKNNALAVTELLQPFLDWSCEQIDTRLNGMLLNWYDGQSNHYIGAHRDDMRDLLQDSPIVTISLGQERVFRMRPYKGTGFKDVTVRNGEVIVIPYDTNLHWTHEVPDFKKYDGKRISVTLRAYV